MNRNTKSVVVCQEKQYNVGIVVADAPWLIGEKAMTIMMSRKALEEYGLVHLGNINWNLSPAVLVEHALARNEGMLAANGAFAATTGSHTGRSPKDKFIVANEESAAKIWWGEYNHPMSPETFEGVRRSLAADLLCQTTFLAC
jgi:phosphoenolpyruvate carboxykinase (ATP)